MRSDYFVYTYSYPDGTPFYVGKGCGRRHRVHLCHAKASRNLDKWNIRVIRKLLDEGKEPIIKKIIENVDNEFACFLEEELISKYGRRDLGTGTLVNLTRGGDGVNELSPKLLTERNRKFCEGGVNTRFKPGVKMTLGIPKSDETKRKMSLAKLGKKRSDEAKRKQSESMQGYKYMQVQCPHCNKLGAGGSMKRWHFNNCKLYNKEITCQ